MELIKKTANPVHLIYKLHLKMFNVQYEGENVFWIIFHQFQDPLFQL